MVEIVALQQNDDIFAFMAQFKLNKIGGIYTV